MKKTLIALALACISTGAMAEVKLYGTIKMGVESSFGNKANGSKVSSATEVTDYGSRIGFKGSEHLDNGLDAIWQVEQWTRIGTSDSKFGSRDSFIGLQGKFGRLTAGYQHGPLQWMGDTNVWEYNPPNYAAGIYAMDNGTDVYARKVSIQYTTPKWNGFQGRFYVSPSDNNNDGDGSEATIYQAGVSYDHKSGFFGAVSGGYIKGGASNKELKADGSKKDAYQVYGHLGYGDRGFNPNKPWYVAAAYKYSRNVDSLSSTDFLALNTTAAANGDKTYIQRSQDADLVLTYMLNQHVKLKSTVAFGWDYHSIDPSTQAIEKMWGNGKYIQGILGADYAFSKRTIGNAQVGTFHAGDSAHRYRTNVLSVGMIYRF